MSEMTEQEERDYVRDMERAGKCEWVHEAWGPHLGCAEFMTEPERFECQADTTHYVVLKQHGPEGPWVEAHNFCGEHYVEAMVPFNTGDSDFEKIITFGRLA